MTTWASFAAIFLLIFGWKTNPILSAKILAIMPVPSPSHHIWTRALTVALAGRGHQITIITPDAEKKPVPNLTEIIIEGVYEKIHESGYDYEEMASMSIIDNSVAWFDWGQLTSEYSINTKAIDKLLELKEKETFDLILMDMTLHECYLALVPLFNSPPVIAITAYASPPWYNQIVGNPQFLAYTSSYILPYSDHMTFLQRTANFLLHNYVMFHYYFTHLPANDDIARKRFGDSVPLPSELVKNISLVMVNTHLSMDYPRPCVPALIEVGGMQVKPAKELPKDIKKYLDEAEHGVIFFSLGSNIRSDKLKKENVNAFLKAFSELPQKVLWKWESDVLPNQPKNVMARKWLPQTDILAHPNVRLFISHSGMLSTQEAVYYGVPVVGMPFLADQFYNIFKLQTHGLAEYLSVHTLSKQTILKALHKVLDNPSYKENMKKMSTLYRDRPETPLEKAVFWTEYVIRHKGAPHLRAHSADMPLYQYLLLDVIGALIVAVVLILSILYLVIKKIYRFVVPSKKNKKSKQQ